jgi:hypothetical protein
MSVWSDSPAESTWFRTVVLTSVTDPLLNNPHWRKKLEKESLPYTYSIEYTSWGAPHAPWNEYTGWGALHAPRMNIRAGAPHTLPSSEWFPHPLLFDLGRPGTPKPVVTGLANSSQPVLASSWRADHPGIILSVRPGIEGHSELPNRSPVSSGIESPGLIVVGALFTPVFIRSIRFIKLLFVTGIAAVVRADNFWWMDWTLV